LCNFFQDPIQPPKPKINRVTPPEKQDPNVKFKEAEVEAKGKDEWGTGEAGYAAPREASDRLRYVFFVSYTFSFPNMPFTEGICLTR
jgi:hypothetical protein